MARIRQAQQYQAMQDAIKATARRLLAEQGPDGLSLRRIARDLDLAAPSLYHYFPDRDALISALIVDAFNALADALAAARDSQEDLGPAVRLHAVLLAYRDWALTHPTDF